MKKASTSNPTPSTTNKPPNNSNNSNKNPSPNPYLKYQQNLSNISSSSSSSEQKNHHRFSSSLSNVKNQFADMFHGRRSKESQNVTSSNSKQKQKQKTDNMMQLYQNTHNNNDPPRSQISNTIFTSQGSVGSSDIEKQLGISIEGGEREQERIYDLQRQLKEKMMQIYEIKVEKNQLLEEFQKYKEKSQNNLQRLRKQLQVSNNEKKRLYNDIETYKNVEQDYQRQIQLLKQQINGSNIVEINRKTPNFNASLSGANNTLSGDLDMMGQIIKRDEQIKDLKMKNQKIKEELQMVNIRLSESNSNKKSQQEEFNRVGVKFSLGSHNPIRNSADSFGKQPKDRHRQSIQSLDVGIKEGQDFGYSLKDNQSHNKTESFTTQNVLSLKIQERNRYQSMTTKYQQPNSPSQPQQSLQLLENQTQIQELFKKVKQLKRNLEDEKQTSSKLLNDKIRYQNQHLDLESKIDKLKAKIEEKDFTIKQIERQLIETDRFIDEKNQAIKRRDEEIQKYRGECLKVEEKLHKLEKVSRENERKVREDVANLQRVDRENKRAIDSYQQRIEELQKLKIHEPITVTTPPAVITSKKSSQSHSLQRQQQRSSALQQKLKQSQKFLSTYKKQFKIIEEEHHDSISRLSQEIKQKDKLQIKLEEQQMQNKTLLQKIQQHKQSRQNLKEEAYKIMKKQKESIKSLEEKYNQLLKEKQEENAISSDRIRLLSERYKKQKEEMGAIEQQREFVKQKISHLVQQRKQFQEISEGLSKDMKYLKTVNTQLKEENLQLKQSLQQRQQQLQQHQAATATNSQLQNFRQKQSLMRQAITTLSEQISQKQNTITIQQQKLSKFQQIMKACKLEHNEVIEQNALLEKHNQLLRRQVYKLTNILEEHRQIKAEQVGRTVHNDTVNNPGSHEQNLINMKKIPQEGYRDSLFEGENDNRPSNTLQRQKQYQQEGYVKELRTDVNEFEEEYPPPPSVDSLDSPQKVTFVTSKFKKQEHPHNKPNLKLTISPTPQATLKHPLIEHSYHKSTYSSVNSAPRHQIEQINGDEIPSPQLSPIVGLPKKNNNDNDDLYQKYTKSHEQQKLKAIFIENTYLKGRVQKLMKQLQELHLTIYDQKELKEQFNEQIKIKGEFVKFMNMQKEEVLRLEQKNAVILRELEEMKLEEGQIRKGLQQEIELLRHSKQQLYEELNKMTECLKKSEIDKQKDKTEIIREVRIEMEKKIEFMVEDAQIMKQEKRQLIRENRDERQKLEKQIQTRQQLYREERKKLTDKITSLEEELQKQTEKSKHVNDKFDELTEKLCSSNQRREEMEIEYFEMKKENALISGMYNKIQSKWNKLEEYSWSLERENIIVQKQITALIGELKQLKDKVKQLESKEKEEGDEQQRNKLQKPQEQASEDKQLMTDKDISQSLLSPNNPPNTLKPQTITTTLTNSQPQKHSNHQTITQQLTFADQCSFYLMKQQNSYANELAFPRSANIQQLQQNQRSLIHTISTTKATSNQKLNINGDALGLESRKNLKVDRSVKVYQI